MGTFIGSSILTVLVVFIVLRYRRKRQDRRDRDRERDRDRGMSTGGSGGGGGYYGGEKRPNSYNSMADTMARGNIREKELTMFSPESETTKVGGLSSRTMTESNNGNNIGGYNTQANNMTGARGPTTTTSEQLAAGEAITTNYARNVKAKERKPLKLSDPPPAKPKKAAKPKPTTPAVSSDDEGDDDKTPPSDSGKWNLFPKIDPSPRRASRPLQNPFAKQTAAAAGGAKAMTTDTLQRPNSSLSTPLNLQKWLERATAVSPFGPLDNNNNNNNNSSSSRQRPPSKTGGLPGSVRLSEVKWPLQDSGPMRSESNGGMTTTTTTGSSGGSGQAVPVVKNNEAARTVPKPSMGLPGPMRKLPLRDK